MKKIKNYKKAWNIKKIKCLGSGKDKTRNAEKVKVVLELRQKYPFYKIFNYLKLSRSTYYYNISTMAKDNKDLHVQKRIKENLSKITVVMAIEELF